MLILPHHGIHPTIPRTAYIAPNATVIGEVTLGEHASIWFNTILRGDVHFIRIGARTNVQDNSTVHVTNGKWPTIVGDDVVVGHNVVLHGCVVSDRVLVGIGAIVLDGAEIGEESIIGAGSLVTPGTKIPPRSLVFGRPGRVVRQVSDQEVEEMILYGVKHYLEYKESYASGSTSPGA
jgi:carbonic anhydrase/acetyltransferase-like protein (isoleucine patch superfamily)